MKNKCEEFIPAKKGNEICYFCGQKADGRYFLNPHTKSHSFECNKCNKKHSVKGIEEFEIKTGRKE